MTDNRRKRAEEIFQRAMERPVAERAGFVRMQCGTDGTLRSEVEALLTLTVTALGDFLSPGGSTRFDEQAPAMPQRIGQYSIIGKLGEGGMGIVYLAEQDFPVRRQVAIKLLKLDQDAREFVNRFDSERQALAMMNHPSIAAVYGAGSTESGRPYFVMEYVSGEPFTEYCDKHRLTIPERLRLFIQVCDALQHAHQKRVIHRDIKPSNVLIMLHDGAATPKVIDFGVARMIDRRLANQTVVTQHGMLIGTPEYMSPEQASGILDIDTRTDVYGLGVLLYECLTGTPPFDLKQLRTAAYAEMQRIIREEEPPRPSMRLSHLADALPSIAASRRVEPRKLGSLVRGELDWIVMKCLEKDRTRRYQTTNDLSLEIRRYLNNEPVLAGPPSAIYRLRKFVRRNRVPVIAGSLVAAALVLGLGGTTWGVLGAIRARNEALLSQRTLERVNEYVAADLLGVTSPLELGPNATLREALDRSAQRLRGQFDTDPLVEAYLRTTFGNVYYDLSKYQLAEHHLARALELRILVAGEESRVTILSMSNLGRLYLKQGRYREAERLLKRADDLAQRVLGGNHADTLVVRNNLALAYDYQSRYADALPLFEEVFRHRRRVLGDKDPTTLDSANNVAQLYLSLGRAADAERLLLEMIAVQERELGREHPRAFNSRVNLASVYMKQGRFPDAERIYLEVLEAQQRVLGREHSDCLLTQSNLSMLYDAMGRFVESEQLLMIVITERERLLGPEHPATLMARDRLAALMTSVGRNAEAAQLATATLDTKQRVFGPEHEETLASMSALGTICDSMGRVEDAERLLKQAVDGGRRWLGSRQPSTVAFENNLAKLLDKQKRYADAEELLANALSVTREQYGDAAPTTILAKNNLASVYANSGKWELATPLFAETVADARNVFPSGHLTLAAFLIGHGECLTASARFDEAEAALAEAQASIFSQDSPFEYQHECLNDLVSLYDAWNAAVPNKGYARRADEWRSRLSELDASAQPASSQPVLGSTNPAIRER